jgi:asparagine synthase (glutamine-hydrolysing)
MCGIAGAVGAIDPAVETAVRAMAEAEAHRGPDDSGFFRSEETPGVALGFRRLAIMDLSMDGHQPMIDPRERNAVVFNGEIYNYGQLREQLAAEGCEFRSRGDTEVLLKAYARWGAGALTRLRGMFAFAMYDPRRREVLLARDRLGIKPLYYAAVERPGGPVLLFASELRALLATGLLPRRLDPGALSTFMWNGFVVGPGTAAAGISLLGPGEMMRLSLDRPAARPERYWSLGTRAPLPRQEAIDGLRRALLGAAEQHLLSDVPLGVFLSGGIDSSAVTALAVRAGGRRVKTFHVGFEEAAFDESSYARRVSEALGTEHLELRLTQERFRADLGGALTSLDQPTFDGINTYFVSRLVREAGFTVALAGTGGDELFGGYDSFVDLPKGVRAASAARALPRAALRLAARLVRRVKMGAAGEVPPQTRWGKLADLLATRGAAVGAYQVSYGLYTEEFLAQLSAGKPGNGSSADGTSRGLPLAREAELAQAIRGASPLAAVGLLELALFIGERLLRDTDGASMAASLEVRVPLLDHEVVEAAQAVPDADRFQPLGKKSLLRTLAMPDLDPSIFDRPKAGFVLPIELWAKDQLAENIETLFTDRPLVESVGLQPLALGRLWRAFKGGAPGIYWSRIWAPFVLLHWCRQNRMELS